MSNERASSAHFSLRRRTVRNRTLVVLAIAGLVGSMLAVAAARPVSVLAAGADHFTIDTVPGQTAGTAFDVTITAFDAGNAPVPDYTGSATLDGSLSASTLGCSGPCEPVYGAIGPFDSNGVATASVTAYAAEAAVHLIVSDGTATGQSGDFAVGPAALGQFLFAPIGTQTAGTPFNVGVAAADVYGNTRLDYAGSPVLSTDLSASSNSDDPTATLGAFDNGDATASVTAYAAETGHLTVTDGLVESTSDPFDVAPGPLDSIFLDPASNTITADHSQTYTAIGYDQYGNSRGD
ncbi:MAG: hypothetical protein ABJC39_12045, partial [Chloroflexota bacterium]